MDNLGERFKRLRQSKGLSQTGLERKVNSQVTQGAIWKIENNKSMPTTSTLQILATAFDMTVTELMVTLGIEEQAAAGIPEQPPELTPVQTITESFRDEIASTLLELLHYPHALPHVANFLREADSKGITIDTDPEYILSTLEDALLQARREARAERYKRHDLPDNKPETPTSKPNRHAAQ